MSRTIAEIAEAVLRVRIMPPGLLAGPSPLAIVSNGLGQVIEILQKVIQKLDNVAGIGRVCALTGRIRVRCIVAELTHLVGPFPHKRRENPLAGKIRDLAFKIGSL